MLCTPPAPAARRIIMLRSSLLFAAFVAIAACLATVTATQYTPAALADQIGVLPGLSVQANFNQFSGYLNVPGTRYVESQNAPATDPLIWWSNGGPGCSGLIALLTEHGPFRTTPQNTIEPYEYSWNRIANVLYVEAPAGVGFSYSLNSSDYNTGDAQTASDNYQAILQFFVRFPHLTSNDFYLSAESYGGHYVPQLTQVILQSTPYLSNFRGFLLGNPLTDDVENSVYGQCETLCGHSLASKPSCDALYAQCIDTPSMNQSNACGNAQGSVAGDVSNIDPYGIDYPVCNESSKQAEKRRILHRLFSKSMKYLPQKFKDYLRGRPVGKENTQIRYDENGGIVYDPCMVSMNEEAVYLTRQDVMTALHISPNAFAWAGCSGNVNYDSEVPAIEPVYQTIMQLQSDLRMVIYSGDDDTVCGTLGTQEWMYAMFGNGVTSKWTQWFYNSAEYGKQIGGSVVQFTNISLVTVHSAGHMVAGYQPERGFSLLQHFLAGDYSTTSQKPPAKIEHGEPKQQHHREHRTITLV